LKTSDPDDFAAVLAGLTKLRNRQYHREPLSKALGEGLFELRHVGKLNTRVLCFCKEPPDHCSAWHTQQGAGHPGPRSRNCTGAHARLAEENATMKKTNFDHYLEEQLQDPAIASRFEHAGEAWDVALQISALRQQAGLSQKELAKLLHTSQQQISRLESAGYEGHSLSMLRRVAEALHSRVRVIFEPVEYHTGMHVAETPAPYQAKRIAEDAGEEDTA
jgi:transcriptional regulator with XRE-family HTH domain